MDPITLTGALAIVRTLGIDKLFGRLIAGEKGGEVASKVMTVAQRVSQAKTPDDALAAIQSDAALAHTMSMELYKLAAEENARMFNDLADARAMQEFVVSNGDMFSRRFIYYMSAGMLTFTFLFMLLASFIPPENADNQRTMNMTLAFLMGSCVGPILKFFFGNSPTKG